MLVQAGAGEASSNPDEAYREAGATIVPDAPALYGQADVVLRVGRPSDEEVDMLREGTVLIGTLGTLAKPELAREAGQARRDRHQHGRHPAHHPRAVDGHPLQPGDGRRLQGRADRRGAAAEVHAAAHHRGRHRPPGEGHHHGRRRGRAHGHRHRPPARRGGRGDRRAPGRQGAGRRAWAAPSSRSR